MNISSTTTTISSLTATLSTASVAPVTDNQSTQEAAGTGFDSPAHAQFSKMGQLMSQLQNLESTNPDQAKQVLSNIASQLNSQAQADGGNSHLTALANKFSQAASTGDLSVLQPPQSGGGGHHHHHVQASSSSSDTGDGSDSTDQSQAVDQLMQTVASGAANAGQNKLVNYTQGNNPMQQIESIISNALQGVSST